MFRNICSSLINKQYLNDECEPFVLIDKATQKEVVGDNIINITDVRDFDMDNKNVISAVNDRIKRFINTDEEASHTLTKLYKDIYSFLLRLSDEFECDYLISEITPDITKLMKLFQFSVEDSDAEWFDKLLSIITLYADLFPKKVLCFFNVKEWLGLDEMDILINHIVSQKIKVLLIESVECIKKNAKEYKIIIDDNFDEIVLNNK